MIYITVTETGRTRPHTASNSLVCQEATSSRIPIGFLVSYSPSHPSPPRGGMGVVVRVHSVSRLCLGSGGLVLLLFVARCSAARHRVWIRLAACA